MVNILYKECTASIDDTFAMDDEEFVVPDHVFIDALASNVSPKDFVAYFSQVPPPKDTGDYSWRDISNLLSILGQMHDQKRFDDVALTYVSWQVSFA